MVEMVKSKMRCSSSIVHHFVARVKKVEKRWKIKIKAELPNGTGMFLLTFYHNRK